MIRQGHKYRCWLGDVLALESANAGELVKVAAIDHSQPYPLGRCDVAEADELQPLAMAYFHGQVPA